MIIIEDRNLHILQQCNLIIIYDAILHGKKLHHFLFVAPQTLTLLNNKNHRKY